MRIRAGRFRPVPRTRRASLAGCRGRRPAGGQANGQRVRAGELLVACGLPAALLDPVEMDAGHRPDRDGAVADDGEGRKVSHAAVGL